jgi:hypothetical protein
MTKGLTRCGTTAIRSFGKPSQRNPPAGQCNGVTMLTAGSAIASASRDVGAPPTTGSSAVPKMTVRPEGAGLRS